MLRTAAAKIAWVGRTASMVLGLALVLALILGVATTAMGANGQNFILGKATNAATKVTGLVGNVDGGAALRVTNPNTGTNDTALDLRVQNGEAPMMVNSAGKVANLNADQLDGEDSAGFLSSERIYVVTRVQNPGPNTITWGGAACDEEDMAISGGFGGVETTTHVTRSSPNTPFEYSWAVETRTSSTAGDLYNAYAMCADLPPLRP